MFLTVDVLEVDVLVVDVLELDVLGARQPYYTFRMSGLKEGSCHLETALSTTYPTLVRLLRFMMA
jgi:hypothetical protein